MKGAKVSLASDRELGFDVETPERKYFFVAPDEEQLMEWHKALVAHGAEWAGQAPISGSEKSESSFPLLAEKEAVEEEGGDQGSKGTA